MVLILIVWTALVTSMTTVTVVRDDCLKEKKCTIVPQKIGVSIEKNSESVEVENSKKD